MKILVTGATGGLGRLVIPQLLKVGHQVVATSTSVQKAKELPFFKYVTYIAHNLNAQNAGNLFTFFQCPDLVIHLAWEKLNEYKNEGHLTTILQSHKAFAFNLLSNGLKDFTVVGTCYEYGLTEGELTEAQIAQPTLPYPKAKLALKEYIDSLKNEYDFNFKWIRVFYVFGEIYGRKNLYTLLTEAIANQQKNFNMSGGEQIRDFLTPLDIAQNIAQIATQQKITGIINCCSGKPVKLKNFVLDYLTQYNCTMLLNLGFYPYADYEPMETWGSVTKLNLCKVQ